MQKLSVEESLKASVTHFENSLNEAIESGEFDCALDKSSLRHFFVPEVEQYGCGTYTRELTVPKGMAFVGKLHKHSHMTFLLKGALLIVSSSGKEKVEAPHTWVSPVGAKRAFYALEDSILTTVHLTKHLSKDKLPDIEDEVIAPSYTSMGLDEPDLKLFLENK
jgi:hypothetical protein